MKIKTFGILGLVLLTGFVGFAAGWVLCRLDVFRPSAIPATSPESEKLRWVDHADVVADFRQHVEREHDMRFLSEYGLSFSEEYPGLRDSPQVRELVQGHGSRRIEGVTDIITSSEHERLQEKVFSYATQYNAMLMGYLECQK